MFKFFSEKYPLQKANAADAGFDLHSMKTFTLKPHSRTLVPTGITLELQHGFVGLVCPRSGLAHKHGVTVLNAPGIVDAGYRGEIFVNLYNASDKDVEITKGDRIAQLAIQQCYTDELVRVRDKSFLEDLDNRGTQGHGSSGR